MIILAFKDVSIVKDEILVRFGNKIREIRKDKGISQERLAELSEIDRSYMGRIERGEMNVTITKVYQISIALNIDPSELIT